MTGTCEEWTPGVSLLAYQVCFYFGYILVEQFLVKSHHDGSSPATPDCGGWFSFGRQGSMITTPFLVWRV